MSAGSMIKALRSLGILGLGEIARAVSPAADHASRSAAVGGQGHPIAYRGPWPIRSHRTLAEVWGTEMDVEGLGG